MNQASTPWYLSRTIWVSIVTTGVGIAAGVGLLPESVAAYIEANAETAISALLAVAGIGMGILRLDTSKPIQGAPKDRKP